MKKNKSHEQSLILPTVFNNAKATRPTTGTEKAFPSMPAYALKVTPAGILDCPQGNPCSSSNSWIVMYRRWGKSMCPPGFAPCPCQSGGASCWGKPPKLHLFSPPAPPASTGKHNGHLEKNRQFSIKIARFETAWTSTGSHWQGFSGHSSAGLSCGKTHRPSPHKVAQACHSSRPQGCTTCSHIPPTWSTGFPLTWRKPPKVSLCFFLSRTEAANTCLKQTHTILIDIWI